MRQNEEGGTLQKVPDLMESLLKRKEKGLSVQGKITCSTLEGVLDLRKVKDGFAISSGSKHIEGNETKHPERFG